MTGEFLMRMILSLFLVLSFFVTPSQLSARGCGGIYNSCFDSNGYVNCADMAVGYTYRQDDICFKSVDVLDIETVHTIEDIQIHGISARGSVSTCDNFYFRGLVDAGWVVDGRSRLKELTSDLDIFSFKGDLNGCNVFDLSGAVGYKVDCGCYNFAFVPLFGYSWHRQDLELKDPAIVFDNFTNLEIDIVLEGFKECYKLNWFGPWIGFDVLVDSRCGFDVFAGFEYHWAEFDGSYSTNGITIDEETVGPFRRTECGCGQGFVGTAGVTMDFCCDCTLFLMGSYQAWDLKSGHYSDQDADFVEMHQLDWKTWAVTVGLATRF